ncbi:hypothetical protein OP10G_0673 [Fimbriimonas ginsengisoli Gsoil 348]|uniref:Uncharacterized protein n=1 Tax=Fimbriimonas ginsengisoli Gsoil 348 TaxID=661478 RepID=A0A068NKQ9_FIMGI|nr:hypothetical protein OP10G_0673 [Fimbriimonas ginsengisoli Gsoil 348]
MRGEVKRPDQFELPPKGCGFVAPIAGYCSQGDADLPGDVKGTVLMRDGR